MGDRRWRWRWRGLWVAVLAAWGAVAVAQQRGGGGGGGEPVARGYDVSDFYMFGRPDDQPAPAPKPLGPDDAIGRPPTGSRSELRDGIVRLIRDNVAPKSWQADVEGAIGMRFRDGELVVTQTPANHRQIASILRQLRESNTPEARLMTKLADARLASKRFDEARVAAVIDWVAEASGVKIAVDWRGFADAGIGPDAPVTLDLTEPLAGRALRAALGAAARGREVPVDINVVGDTVRIVFDRKAADTDQMSRAYDVHLMPARAAGLDPSKSYPRQEVVDALVKRVRSSTRADAVRESQGLLIVTAPRPVQAEVSRLLDTWDAEAMEERGARR